MLKQLTTPPNLTTLESLDNVQRLAEHGTPPVDIPIGNEVSAVAPSSEVDQPAAKGWKFWAIFPPLCIATLLVALESTVTSTSLPMITAALDSGDNYVWILNGYLLMS